MSWVKKTIFSIWWAFEALVDWHQCAVVVQKEVVTVNAKLWWW